MSDTAASTEKSEKRDKPTEEAETSSAIVPLVAAIGVILIGIVVYWYMPGIRAFVQRRIGTQGVSYSDGTTKCQVGRGNIPPFPTSDETSGAIDHIYGVPDMEWFYMNYIRASRPALLHGVTAHWSALQKWSSDAYLKTRIGHLTVKVERSSTHEFGHWANEVSHGSDWAFWNVTFSKFVDELYLDPNAGDDRQRGQWNHWYLDTEFPAPLARDISLPEYVPCMSDQPRPPYWRYLNMWMGGGLENSLLHNDLEDNLLQVVAGYKRVTLVDPTTPSEWLYEIYNYEYAETKLSPVNVENPNLDKYPLFKNVRTIQVVLKPGDVLFIPAFWWHQVASFCRHISVNVWFDMFNYKAMGLDYVYTHTSKECVEKLRTHSPLCTKTKVQ